jgi:ABC-type nitrate/sulfonate/bicarbonate transport system substrate-binding protein
MRLDAAVPNPRGGIRFRNRIEVPSSVKIRRLLLAAVIVAAGCGPSSQSPAPSATGPAGSTPASPSGAESGAPSASLAVGRVRLALDWTPNTNHTGFFVARQKGWYRDAAVELEILPYASATPETLLAAHQAECGISFQDSMTFAVAAGIDIVSVAAILQKTASAIGVLASGPIQRPRDLDGKTYAGFGYPNEDPTLKAVIRADGGTGVFKTATLDAAAYEALYSKRADFTIPFTAWEGVEAKLRGIELRYFQFADYGFPEYYQVVLACDRQWLAANPDLAKRFVAATARGFQLAADDPEEAAAILVSENPGVFDANRELPLASQRFLREGGYLIDADGRFGTQTLERWTAYSRFLYEQGLLVDRAGKPLAAPLDYAALFTNDYLR